MNRFEKFKIEDDKSPDDMISDCCNSEIILRIGMKPKKAGRLWRAYVVCICKKCEKVCEPIKK